MKNSKKLLSLLLCCLMVLAATATTGAFAERPLKIITTIFPPYDFVRQIAGDTPVELSMLLAPGAESHSFEPSPQDIINIQNSDIFIYAGGEGDAWLSRILDAIDTDNTTLVAMTDLVQTVDEEIVEGMEHAHDDDAEPFDPSKVYDRALTDWTGAWKSLAPYVEDRSLDAYIQYKADSNEISFEEQFEKTKNSWRTNDFTVFMIAGDKVYIDYGDQTASGTYQYEGYAILEKETGTSVWYQYSLVDAAEGMPKHLIFNDHGFGAAPGDAEDAHDHGVAHTHLRYGDESLEELVHVEGWSTFFVDAGATTDEILDTLLGHDSHGHSHSNERTTFEDDEVLHRPLSDWADDWQSIYPYLLDGSLDSVMEHKAESGEKTAEEYHDYYRTGYATDVERIIITDNTMEFFANGVSVKAEYAPAGYEILTYESGNKGVRYQFEAIGETNGAPAYIQFSDHLIAPEKTGHFHIYAGNDGFDALLEEMDNWPTYYPSRLTRNAIVEEMIGHDSGAHSHEGEIDEHVWTAPTNAMIIVQKIANIMMEKDREHADIYADNAAAYIAELEALDAAFADVVENGVRKTILFGDRFPFRYFVDAYGLDYFAAFSGCSTSTDASAATIAFLIDKAREDKLPVVFSIELSNGLIASTIAEASDATALEFHSGHNVTMADYKNGITYLDIMWRNVDALAQALQ